MPVVYIDQFVVINLALNFILLYLTKKILHSRTSNPRLFLGSVIGAVYAIFLFVPHADFLFTLSGKLLFSLVLIAITYRVGSLKNYLRTLAVFYLVCFIFGGCALAVLNFVQRELEASVTLKILITSTVIAYFVLTCISAYYKRTAVRQYHFGELTVVFQDKTVAFQALIDTGNSLYDPLSKLPVIVADFQKICPLLPPELSKVLGENQPVEQMADTFGKSGISHRFRLIPYRSVGNSSGFIIGFRPDSVAVDGTQADAIIGLSPHRVSSDDSYFALINPQALKEMASHMPAL